MRILLVALVACACLGALGVLAPPAARAEDLAAYEVEGDAPIGGDDPRIAALDEAFSRAVSGALGDVLDPETRKAQRALLNQHILGRARLWIANFVVTKDETRDGRRHVAVTARVDRDKLRARLSELGIAATAEPVRPHTRGVVVLLRITGPDGTRATYGAGAAKDLPGLGPLAAALRGAALTIKRPPVKGPAAAPTGDLPLDDAAAEALAADAGAQLAALAGVSVGPPVAVRGVAGGAVLVTAHVRVIERGAPAMGYGVATVAARGAEPSAVGAAIERALLAAASDVLPAAKQALTQGAGYAGDDAPLAEPGVVLVRLAARTPWAMVAAEQRYLAGAKGVQRAVLRRVSPSGWVIGVTTTESIDRIAQIARKPPAADTVARVRVVDGIVEVSVSSSSGGAP